MKVFSVKVVPLAIADVACVDTSADVKCTLEFVFSDLSFVFVLVSLVASLQVQRLAVGFLNRWRLRKKHAVLIHRVLDFLLAILRALVSSLGVAKLL